MRLLIATLFAFFASSAVFAADGLGTAGKFHRVDIANCGKPFAEQFQGACDPPPVDSTIPIPAQIEAHLERAQRLVSLMRMPQARAAADTAVQLDPRNVAALKFRARLAATMMDYRTALNDVNQALALDPADADLLATRAELRMGGGELRPALADADAAVKAQPDDADAHLIKARVLMQMEQLRAAVAELDQVLNLAPDLTLARTTRAQVHLRLADFDDALRDANKALQGNPIDPWSLETRAIAHLMLGDLQGALDDYTQMLGKPGDTTRQTPASPQQQGWLVQRLIVLAQLHRDEEVNQDLDMMLRAGGLRAVLRLQIFLRRNGFPDVPLDGKRNDLFEQSLRACFVRKACWYGLAQPI